MYYLEAAPVVAMIVAVGIWHVAARIHADERRVKVASLFVTALLLGFAVPNIVFWRRDHRGRAAFFERFAEELKKLPPHSIVFVKYTPRTLQHIPVVFNSADLAHERVWVVHDLGARNAELRQLVPDRTSFDFEEEQLVDRLKR